VTHRVGKKRLFFLSLCAAALLLGAGPRASAQAYASGDPARGKSIAESNCAACHGVNGNSPDPQFPKLAGQNPAYLYWQLWAFKKATRRSDVMPGIVATLSDAEMADAASFYGQQRRKPHTVKDRHLAAIGERVFFAGMPACAMCRARPGRAACQ
jgi:cytochrome c553